MNETLKTIAERRSIRSYEDKPVEKEKIEKLLEAGFWGPSAKNTQNWHFIVVTNKDVLKKISEMTIEDASDRYPMIKERAKTKPDPILYEAPLLIAVAAPTDYNWGKTDGTIAAQNMVLAAHSLGLGSCYIGMTRGLKDNEEFNEILEMPEGHRTVITIIFGYPKENPEPKPRKEDVVSWVD